MRAGSAAREALLQPRPGQSGGIRKILDDLGGCSTGICRIRTAGARLSSGEGAGAVLPRPPGLPEGSAPASVVDAGADHPSRGHSLAQ